MKAFLFPYKPFSESGKALAKGLGIKRISHKNSKFKGNEDKVVINWGSSVLPEEVAKCRVINKAEAVAIAADKLKTFEALRQAKPGMRRIRMESGQEHILGVGHEAFDDVPDDYVGEHNHRLYGKYTILEPVPVAKPFARIPEYTTNIYQAQGWLDGECTIVERHILNANSGKGIRLVEPGEELQQCPLYVRYIPKKQEYRVHVCAGKAVDIQRKARRKEVEDDAINWKIRNHDNGFIFARNEGHEVPADVSVQAIKACESIGLDFGAVDVIFNEKEQKAYVLEVNTAPGLSGTTLEGYVERLKKLINGEPLVEEIVAAEAPVGAHAQPELVKPIQPKIYLNPNWGELIVDEPVPF